MYDIEVERAYPTPLATSPLLPMLLLSLATQKNAPETKSEFMNEYDYIIVGAGSAGSVVAGRLSEIPCVTILLLEAGKAPPVLTDVPNLARNFWSTDIDWSEKTVPQKRTGNGLVNNQVVWPSGKTLGGSGILNEMLYVRGNHENYDNWAEGGAVGWSYSDVRPYFLKLEDNRDPAYLANGYHSVGGPITAETPRLPKNFTNALLKAAEEQGNKIVDFNGPSQTGYYATQINSRNGQRCSAAKGYLVPAENRTNLDILQNAFVKKILFENNRASGVEFDFEGETRQVRAKREVIMSAGTVHTAQILMLSGIGPKKHLEEFNIPVIADLPVGDNFHDHAGTPLIFEVDSSIPAFTNSSSPDLITEYISNRTGPLTGTASVLAFLEGENNPKPDFPISQLIFIIADIKLLLSQVGLKPEVEKALTPNRKNKSFYICLAQHLQPKSRGTVRLQSDNPYESPLIDPNYFEEPGDLKDVVRGLKECLSIGLSSPMRKIGSFLSSIQIPGCTFSLNIDAFLECAVRSVVVTLSHQVGSAKMGDPKDPTTVVDSELRVKGVEGLRVIDASVMPTIPSGNTNIPTMMVAEKASDILKSTIECYAQTPVKISNESPESSSSIKSPPNKKQSSGLLSGLFG